VSFAGFLEVESELGRGCVFTVALPATLALVRGLLVRTCGRRYALPVSVVWEIAQLQPDAGPRYRLPNTGELIRLVPLAELFGLSGAMAGPGSHSLAAIVGPPERRVGLVVDGLEGQRDLVMKPLGEALGVVPGVAGFAQLGPGEPVLVLDVPALTDEALGRPALRGTL
jgi:two-component system chemotaxis sensor kinase CheA